MGGFLLVARTESSLQAVADEIVAAGGTAGVIPADVSDPDAVGSMAAEVRQRVGDPQVVLHCAGVGRWLFTEETSAEELRQQMALPFLAAFDVTRAFLPAMLEAGRGHICSVGSPYAWTPWPGAIGYGASRWALRGFTEGLCFDLAGTGVQASMVLASEVDSPYFDNNPGTRERMSKLSRYLPDLSPEDVAEAVVRTVAEDRRLTIVPRQFAMAIALGRHFPRAARWVNITAGYRHPAARRR